MVTLDPVERLLRYIRDDDSTTPHAGVLFGRLDIIPGKKPMPAESVQLRLIVRDNSWTAQYRADDKGEFETAATGQLPEPGDDQVSIQCYNGPADAEHWIRFDDFRISKLAE